MMYDPNLVVPPEVIKAVQTVREFAAKHTAGDEWQIGGLTPVQCSIGYYKAKMEAAQRQLETVTAERDAWKGAHANLRHVYSDIGETLGANMPAELVNEVARHRMDELARANEMRDMLRQHLEKATAVARDQVEEIDRLKQAASRLAQVVNKARKK